MNNVDYILLSLPFPEIQWRVGAKSSDNTRGLALGYLDARDVMNRLDAVMGCGWSNIDSKQGDTYFSSITIGEVTRTGGAGSTDVEAEKGGVSDAFKRAGVMFGIGRYLYNLSDHKTWVEIKPFGKSFIIDKSPDNEAILHKAHKAVLKEQIKICLNRCLNLSDLELLASHDVYFESISRLVDADKKALDTFVNTLKTTLKN